jgi:hypothetical protein
MVLEALSGEAAGVSELDKRQAILLLIDTLLYVLKENAYELVAANAARRARILAMEAFILSFTKNLNKSILYKCRIAITIKLLS